MQQACYGLHLGKSSAFGKLHEGQVPSPPTPSLHSFLDVDCLLHPETIKSPA